MASFILPRSAYRPPEIIIYQYESSDLQGYLKTDNFKKIASNTHLFWLAFCKTVAEMNFQPSDKFFVRIEKKLDREYILVGAKEGFESTVDDIQKIIEKIRVFFQDSFDCSRPITFLPINIYEKCYFRRIAPLVNLADWLLNPEYSYLAVSKFQFKDLVRPVIPQLAKQLGMSCTISPHTQIIRTEYVSGRDTKYPCEAITLTPLSLQGNN
jgi:hypothetical protein